MTHYRRPILTHPRQSVFIRISSFDPPAFVAGLDYFAMMSNPVQKSGRHFVISEDLRPLPEGKVSEINRDRHYFS